MYLIDANVLITAHRDYYPMDRVPRFWNWLIDNATNGSLKIPLEIYEEVVPGNGDLPDWLKYNKAVMVLDETADSELVSEVIQHGYASDLTDIEIEKLGMDPFLIAYALVNPEYRSVVTAETSRPSRRRANRHVPDVCSDFGITYIDTFQLIRELDFRT